MAMTDTARQLAEISQWIDDGNAHRDPEACTWGRLAKLAEETGEVIAAYIGATGQNPRKGVTNSMSSVVSELMDAAVTALAAAEHILGNNGEALDYLADRVDYVHHRAGLQETPR